MEMPEYNFAISPALNLINALIHIKEHGPWIKYDGICLNVDNFADESNLRESPKYSLYRKEMKKALGDAIEKWPSKNKVSHLYPVGGPFEYAEERLKSAIWQNPRRLELLDFIIDYLNTEG